MTHPSSIPWLTSLAILISITRPLAAEDAPANVEISGRYPHLAMFNHNGECGTGAVVPWADRLWVITYAPHLPKGSDKLYEIDAELNRTARPESVGGTPADRMIHRESDQLIIGPYLIDAKRNVRVVTPARMPGKLGKPFGECEPWQHSAVKAGDVSDPCLMAGYDDKRLELSHDSARLVRFTVEVDYRADGAWRSYHTFEVSAGKSVKYEFPTGYSAHWVRFRCDSACNATVRLGYN